MQVGDLPSCWYTMCNVHVHPCISIAFRRMAHYSVLCAMPKLQPFLMICDLWRKLSIQPYQIHLSTNATDWTKYICAVLLFLIHLLFDTLRICIIIITSPCPIVFSSFVSNFWFLNRPAFHNIGYWTLEPFERKIKTMLIKVRLYSRWRLNIENLLSTL